MRRPKILQVLLLTLIDAFQILYEHHVFAGSNIAIQLQSLGPWDNNHFSIPIPQMSAGETVVSPY